QSISTRVAPTSATRQLPPLPLASEAKRTNLFQLLEEQRQDAARGAAAVERAFLVEHTHLGALPRGLQLHAVLLGLRLRAGAEHAVDDAPVLGRHLAFGIRVAHEVQAFLPVAILDRETDAIEREADAAPGAVE